MVCLKIYVYIYIYCCFHRRNVNNTITGDVALLLARCVQMKTRCSANSARQSEHVTNQQYQRAKLPQQAGRRIQISYPLLPVSQEKVCLSESSNCSHSDILQML